MLSLALPHALELGVSIPDSSSGSGVRVGRPAECSRGSGTDGKYTRGVEEEEFGNLVSGNNVAWYPCCNWSSEALQCGLDSLNAGRSTGLQSITRR